MKVDVIYASGGTVSAQVAMSATSSIPIVFHSSADPVGLGLVASLAKPGGNVTGLAQQFYEQRAKSLQYLGGGDRETHQRRVPDRRQKSLAAVLRRGYGHGL